MAWTKASESKSRFPIPGPTRIPPNPKALLNKTGINVINASVLQAILGYDLTHSNHHVRRQLNPNPQQPNQSLEAQAKHVQNAPSERGQVIFVCQMLNASKTQIHTLAISQGPSLFRSGSSSSRLPRRLGLSHRRNLRRFFLGLATGAQDVEAGRRCGENQA